MDTKKLKLVSNMRQVFWPKQQAAIMRGMSPEVRQLLKKQYDALGTGDEYNPERAYHNPSHIAEIFGLLNKMNVPLDTPVFEAVWFHDAVCLPRGRNNEEASVVLANEQLSGVLSPENLATLRRIILATKHNAPLCAGWREDIADYVADADLAILGAPPERFNEYCAQIKEEYEWKRNGEYAKARIHFLNSILRRPLIFATRSFQDEYEGSARRNITLEIEKLKTVRSSRWDPAPTEAIQKEWDGDLREPRGLREAKEQAVRQELG
jgi:predicted metal-dependent HD superfamily phosphohydrolase